MELPLNRYRLEIFKKNMSIEDYEYLYNKKIVIEGLMNIERIGDHARLTAKIKRTQYESYLSPVGEELARNLRGMYDDLYQKLSKK